MSQENFWVPKKNSRNFGQNEIDELREPEESSEQQEDDQVESFEDSLPGLIPTKDIYQETGLTLEYIYEWYAKAMAKRFSREPLPQENFVSHFEGWSTDPTFAFGNKDDGYALGYVRHGIFIPTHFAPKTTRGGYRLMQSLGKSLEIPAVLSVTKDLQETLKKMPEWHTVDIKLTSMFRDQLMDKIIMYNNHPDVERLMLELIKDYMAEMGIEYDKERQEKQDVFGEPLERFFE